MAVSAIKTDRMKIIFFKLAIIYGEAVKYLNVEKNLMNSRFWKKSQLFDGAHQLFFIGF